MSATFFAHFHWHQVSANSIRIFRIPGWKKNNRINILHVFSSRLISLLSLHLITMKPAYIIVLTITPKHWVQWMRFFSIRIIIITCVHFEGTVIKTKSIQCVCIIPTIVWPRKKMYEIIICESLQWMGAILDSILGNRAYLKWWDWDYLNYCFYSKNYLAFTVSIEFFFCVILVLSLVLSLWSDDVFCENGHGYRTQSGFVWAHCLKWIQTIVHKHDETMQLTSFWILPFKIKSILGFCRAHSKASPISITIHSPSISNWCTQWWLSLHLFV